MYNGKKRVTSYLSDEEKKESERQSKKVLGSVNLSGYFKYLINKNREL